MSSSSPYDHPYVFFQQNTADDAYFAAGNRFPHVSDNVPSTSQIEQDIDDGIEQYPNTITTDGELNFDLSPALSQDWFAALSVTPNAMPYDQNDFIPVAPRRTDSGLRATAQPFIPLSQQWPATSEWQQSTQLAIPTPQPRTQERLSLMIPPQTPFYNSANDQYAMQARALDSSPLISLTDQDCVTSYPYRDAPGYQWSSEIPPAKDISAWNQSNRVFVDPAQLTPVSPLSPARRGTSLERSASKTSRTSRTTTGSYHCLQHGCDRAFRSKTEYSHHMRNHGPRHHHCAVCDWSFVFRKDLDRHERTHTGQRQMFGDIVPNCQWCIKGFKRKDHYDRHMKKHSEKGDAVTPVDSLSIRSCSLNRQ